MTKKPPKHRDPFDTDEWRAHAEHFRKNVLPQIVGSARCLAIVPETDKFDAKFALEIGAMVVLDKPIVLLVMRGRPISPRLARVADKIIECDLSSESGQRAAQQRLTEYLKQ